MKFSLNFVSAGSDYSTLEKPVAAPYIIKNFEITSLPQRAELTICGIGFYELYVNGKNITKGHLAPYISNPDDILYYDNYDMTDLITIGKNTLGIILGNGMMNNPGGFIWDFDDARFRGVPRVALAFESETLNFETDESFLWHSSPILFDDFRCGVHYDSRKKIADWSLPSCDRTDWNPVIKAEAPRGDCRICSAEPITAQEEIKAISINKASLAAFNISEQVARKYDDISRVFYNSDAKEGYLYDFGVNSAGIYRLEIKGKPGQRIEIQAAEYIDENGDVNYNNIGCFYPESMAHRDVFYCSGEKDVFTLPFTYHGCRYYHVMGLEEEQATPELLTYIVMNSNLLSRGHFSCSDPIANKIQEMAIRSDLANFYYFPTDCPHREKNGWTGDAALSAEHMAMYYDIQKSFAEWMRNISKSLKDNGCIPGIIPTGDWGYDRLNGPAWDVVITEIPYQTYLHYGDKNIIIENANAIWRYLNYAAGRMDNRNLVEYGLGDWCPPDRQVSDYTAPLVLTDSIMTMVMAGTAAYLFGKIGFYMQQAFAESMAKKVRRAIRDHLIDLTTMTAAGNCLTSQAMAMYYDLFEQTEKTRAFKVLLELVHLAGDFMDVGILGARTIFHVLAEHGEGDLAYKMITRPESPSYGNQVLRGRTALPENFNNKSGPIYSLNHHFFGDVSAWFMKRVAGIIVNPNLSDPAEINISPVFITALAFAEASLETIKGCINVNWSRNLDIIELNIEIPNGVYGKIVLPDGFSFSSVDKKQTILPLESGVYTVLKIHFRTNNILF